MSDPASLLAGALDQYESFLFPDTGSIQRASFTQDDERSTTEEWADLHTGLAVQLGAFTPGGGPESEQGSALAITSARELRAMIHGDLADITEADRLVIGERVFDIMGIERDSFALVTTLRVDERGDALEEGS